VTLDVRSDRSVAIRDSVRDIKVTLLLTIGLAVMVIFLFLRTSRRPSFPASPAGRSSRRSRRCISSATRSTPLAARADPSVAFIVDNTIVMLENVVRHMEMGKTPMRAA
jgi:HAE1 family hydrophobic/amphiphilic exporter-1